MSVPERTLFAACIPIFVSGPPALHLTPGLSFGKQKEPYKKDLQGEQLVGALLAAPFSPCCAFSCLLPLLSLLLLRMAPRNWPSQPQSGLQAGGGVLCKSFNFLRFRQVCAGADVCAAGGDAFQSLCFFVFGNLAFGNVTQRQHPNQAPVFHHRQAADLARIH